MSTQAEKKRIAKNTIVLYIRMLLTLFVSLYTSRVVLSALGVEDYGIYNVVGGIVSMFSIISGSLSTSISRFITFELGTGKIDKLKKVFSTSIIIQFILCIIILIVAETVGLWFLNNKMNISEIRMYSANWVFQLSIVTFILNLISVPYNAAIIAHEKMSAFAYISIVEVVFKLIIAYLITISPIDKLIFYAILQTIVAFILRVIYMIYCKKNFLECTVKYLFDKSLIKQMFGFAGWNFIGSISFLLKDQGVNIILNIFCGSFVNASRAISMQINGAVNGFVSNFITAINPQITKSYAEQNITYLNTLIIKGTKFSFFLLLIISVPVIANTEYVLSLWLKEVPKYSVEFVQLILLLSLTDVLYRPLLTAHLATGKIKKLQLYVGGLNMLILPVSAYILYLGFEPTFTVIISIIFSIITLFIRLKLYAQIESFDISTFLKYVILNVFIVSVLLFFIVYNINIHFKNLNLVTFISLSGLYIFISIIIISVFGFSREERGMIYRKVSFFIKKKQKE